MNDVGDLNVKSNWRKFYNSAALLMQFVFSSRRILDRTYERLIDVIVLFFDRYNIVDIPNVKNNWFYDIFLGMMYRRHSMSQFKIQ